MAGAGSATAFEATTVNGVRPAWPRRQNGVALIIVLWVVVLLSLIATGHSRNAHTATQLAAHQVELTQLRSSAQAGVEHAIVELLARGILHPLPVNGASRSVDILGRQVSIAIRAADGLVDLNRASPQLLASLVTVTGADQQMQEALVAAILDWRDVDDLTRLNGAEADAYSSVEAGWTIRNGPFSTVDELRYVAGMSNEYFNRLAPLVTVYSQHDGVNLDYAPAALVAALTGEEIAIGEETLSDDSAAVGSRRGGGSQAGTYHIYVTASSASTSTAATLEAVVRTSPTSEVPFIVLNWRQPMRSRQYGSG